MQETVDFEYTFDGLEQALKTPKKFSIISAGRRTGKTYSVMGWGVARLHDPRTPRKSMLWVDTKHANIDKYVERHLFSILGSGYSRHCSYNKQKKTFYFPNESYIDFGSAERSENLEGFQYDIIVINEGGIVLKRPSLWNNTLLAMTKGTNNLTRIIGTPKGRNKFFELYSLGLSGNDEYEAYRFTSYDSPLWDKEELDRIKETVPQTVFEQEYLAEFTENGTGVFKWKWDKIGWSGELIPHKDKRYSLGVDLAKYQDFTVIQPIDNETLQMGQPLRFNTIDWNEQKKVILEKAKYFNNANVLLDSTGLGDPILDDLRRSGVNITGYKFTATSKPELLTHYALKGEQEEIRIPINDIYLNEHKALQYTLSDSGKLKMEVPQGTHDDTIMAGALAVWQATKNNITWDVVSVKAHGGSHDQEDDLW